MTEVVLVDSGGANIGSVCYALERIGVAAELTADADRIRGASHVILPGVGAAGAAMERLDQHRLGPVIRALEQPVLGICVGMQLLGRGSEEGDVDCLGILPGRARRFTTQPGLRVPHMGWSQLEVESGDPLLDGIPTGAYAYFVHSYALPVDDTTLAQCQYGRPFAAMARRKNFAAAQFHPERSARVGEQLLRNFVAQD